MRADPRVEIGARPIPQEPMVCLPHLLPLMLKLTEKRGSTSSPT